jgi:hypothetical protein
LLIIGPAGQSLTVEASADLKNWMELPATIEETAPGSYRALIPVRIESVRFYRLRVLSQP